MKLKIDFNQRSSRARLENFAAVLLQVADTIPFRVSSRGWCYLLEQAGVMDKSQFDKVEEWINRARRRGLLPIDFVAEEAARSFHGVEIPAGSSPVEYFQNFLHSALEAGRWYEVDWWHGERYYIQMVVEKVDLVTLFQPACNAHHIPIASSKGWSSLLQRADYARRFREAEDKGLECVLLYCGDHDPDGLRISNWIRSNLEDLRDVVWADGTRGYDPRGLHIHRFGLNYPFIQEHEFTWIDNLVTGSGKDLASTGHPNHAQEYVQTYLEEVGARKCEANVLVTRPAVAYKLVQEAIDKWLGPEASARFEARRDKVVAYLDTYFTRAHIRPFLDTVLQQGPREDDIMRGETWYA